MLLRLSDGVIRDARVRTIDRLAGKYIFEIIAKFTWFQKNISLNLDGISFSSTTLGQAPMRKSKFQAPAIPSRMPSSPGQLIV